MLCAISGEAPQVPVVSIKSGALFEKRLIDAYVAEHGKDPVSGEDLTADDILDVKSSHLVRPRPPTLTSIPSLLSVFQNEWDSLALETFTLKQQLLQTRQELSAALYQNDAAIRAIAKLTRERDEARTALSKVSINGGASNEGVAMQVDGQGLSEALVGKIVATQERLSKTRRKRPVPEDWASPEALGSFKAKGKPSAATSGGKSLASDAEGQNLLIGCESGTADIYSTTKKMVTGKLEGVEGAVTDAIWDDSRAIVASSAGTVQVFQDGQEAAKFAQHAGAVTSLASHPSGSLLASVGVDKSFVFYDLDSAKVALQVFTNSSLSTAAFHPDGHLFATGGSDGQIKLFSTASAESAADFAGSGAVQQIAFSENGTWLASASQGQSSVQIWDLRKAAQIASLELATQISTISFDYTGQYLLGAGSNGVVVQHYSKASKEWSGVLQNGTSAIAAVWGPRAESIFVLNAGGAVVKLA